MGRGKVKLNLWGNVWTLTAGYQEPEQQRPGLNQGQLVSVNLAGKTSLFPVSPLPAAPNTVTQRLAFSHTQPLGQRGKQVRSETWEKTAAVKHNSSVRFERERERKKSSLIQLRREESDSCTPGCSAPLQKILSAARFPFQPSASEPSGKVSGFSFSCAAPK